ncbi:MAG: hypothetical protein BZY88_02670 [SAR202 cluster bacterium Io17-Chloro-G9]|nr:MAG: hypothetical protein BZY88_02670 [SAR202 cluster bacterium Io17-Chloro-G9]
MQTKPVNRMPIVNVPRASCPADGNPASAAQNGATVLPASNTPALTETNIFIDGSADDWAGRPVLLDDPAGNGEAGILDLTKGYAFINQHALYLLVKAEDPDAVFSNFEVQLQLGSRRLEVGWAPHWNQANVADVTGQYELLRQASRSEIAFGPALEARIDLRDLGPPDSVKLMGVNVRAGECCEAGEWRIADRWEPLITIPVLDRLDANYVIDGKDGDWTRAALSKDPAGDERPGYLDLTTGYAFVSEGSLYLYVDAEDATAPVDTFQIFLQTGRTRLEVAWGPG